MCVYLHRDFINITLFMDFKIFKISLHICRVHMQTKEM